jgi:hypothetical protein
LTQKLTILLDGKELACDSVRIEVNTAAPESKSPTGREPRVLWSGAWQARWEKALADKHPWTEWLIYAVGHPTEAYYDKELLPCLLFQITGDVTFARQAWVKMAEKADPGRVPSSDGLRENFLAWIICYEWAYPALTAEERAAFEAHLDRCCQQASDVALGDSDRVVAYYMGVAVWAALGSEVAKGVLASERYAQARQRLSEWAELAKGGEFIEGSGYNRNTVTTLLQGLACLRDLGAEDKFPELWAVVPDFALASVHRMSGDLKARFQWGALAKEAAHAVYQPDAILAEWAVEAELADSDVLRWQIARFSQLGGDHAKPRAEFFLFGRPDSFTVANWSGTVEVSQ